MKDNAADKSFLDELARLTSMYEKESHKEEKRLSTKEDIELDTLREELEGKRQDRKQRGNLQYASLSLCAVTLSLSLLLLSL